ncbi:MAG: prepilin-type N-terminal cleavage/methylation domain-containing protein [Sumerlaeia bacterium]
MTSGTYPTTRLGRRTDRSGFTLLEIMIVVFLLGMLIALAIPGFFRARERSRQRACQENLNKINGAVHQYVLEYNFAGNEDLAPLWPAEFIGRDRFLNHLPQCAAGGTYVLGSADDEFPATCTRIGGIFPHTLPVEE